MAGFFAGLVDGIVAGKNIKEGREDRARLRKMQDEEFTWKREDQNWQREDRSFTRSERQRAIKERDAERAAWEETADERYGPQDGSAPTTPAADTPSAPTDTARTSPQDDMPTGTKLGFSINDALTVSTKDQPAPDAPATGIISDGLTSGASTTPKNAAPTASTAGGFSLGVVGAGAGAAAGNAPAQGMSMGITDAVPPPPRPQITQPQQGAGSARPGAYQAAATEQRIQEQTARQAQDPLAVSSDAQLFANAARGMVAEAESGYTQAQAAFEANPNGDTQAAVVKATERLKSARKEAESLVATPVIPRERQTYTDRGALAAEGPEATGRAAPMPAKAPETARDAAPTAPTAPSVKPAQQPNDAPQAMPKTPDGTPLESLVSVQTSAEKLSFGIVGKDGVVKTTAERLDRAAEQSIKAYKADHVPAIVEHYVRTGQPEKAQAFQQFIKKDATERGMKSWARAMVSMNINDGDGLLDNLAATYNNDGYYDDGLSVVRDKSTVTYDDKGNIVGASITFRDESTGKTFVNNISGARDMMVAGLGALAPEATFETGWAATDPAGGISAKDRAQMGIDANAQVEELAAPFQMAGTPLTEAQKDAMRARILAGESPWAAGGATSGNYGDLPLYR